MIRSTALAATLATVAATGTACGGGDGPSHGSAEARDVQASVRAWFRDLAAGDGAHGCTRLTRKARAQFVANFALASDIGCERAVALAALTLSEVEKRALPRVRIRRVDVRGTRAEVDDRDAEFPRAVAQRVEVNDRPTVFVRREGRWLLEDLG